MINYEGNGILVRNLEIKENLWYGTCICIYIVVEERKIMVTVALIESKPEKNSD